MTNTTNTAAASGTADNCTILPDGSAFAVGSFPLPQDHWLYAPHEYEPGSYEPKELLAPILTHAQRNEVVAAVRYAVRGATMCGKEPDFDPDALVQNAVYALCGSFGRTALATTAQATPAAVAGPVAVLKFERGTPGRENEMPRVVSCNWMPDGEYEVYLAAAPTTQPAPQQEAQEPHGWLYEWTHSSATGKPDATYTAFTTDEAHASKHDNCRAVYTAPQPLPVAQAIAAPCHARTA
jgi:hypothetical protein